MKIRRITLKNFKNFGGVHAMDLMPSGDDRNVVLIGGLNGAGKTTFVEAIRLCLFGTRQGSGLVSEAEYGDYIKSCFNRDAARAGEHESYVQLDIAVDDVEPPFDIGVRRQWNFDAAGRVGASLALTRDGRPFEVVPQEFWEDYLAGLVPGYLAGYVFFDGELVNELAVGSRADQLLQQSVRDVIGLNLSEKLRKDLGLLIERVRRRNVHEGALDKEISEKEYHSNELARRIEVLDSRIKTNSDMISKTEAAARTSDEELRRVTGQYTKSHQVNQSESLRLGSELAKLDTEIVTACGEVLPFAIPAHLCGEVRRQLGTEQLLKRAAAGRALLDEVKQRLVSRMRSKSAKVTLGPEQREAVEYIVDGIFSDLERDAAGLSSTHVLHDLPAADAARVASSLEDPRRGLKRRLTGLLRKRETLLASAKSVGKKIKAGPDADSMRQFIAGAAEVRSESTRLRELAESMAGDRDKLVEELDSLRSSISALEEKVVCAKDDQEKIDVASRTILALDAYMRAVEEAKRGELETAVAKMYMQLANKDDMVDSVKVDGTALSVKLFDKHGTELDKRRISAGEKQVYALSVLWGLSRISSKRLPLVVDSPLAKLDSTHVHNIVGRFFPNAAEQVIILSHDREVDAELYAKLKPRVCREYTLEIHGKQKIVEGYFGS